MNGVIKCNCCVCFFERLFLLNLNEGYQDSRIILSFIKNMIVLKMILEIFILFLGSFGGISVNRQIEILYIILIVLKIYVNIIVIIFVFILFFFVVYGKCVVDGFY